MRCYFSEDAIIKETTPVDNLFIMEYMPRAGGRALAVYLYGLMKAHFPSFEQDICEALNITHDELVEAFKYWQSEGLLNIRSTDPVEVEYSYLGLKQSPLLIPGKYGSLVHALQSLFAPRMLSASELRHVYDWADVFLLGEDVILELASYCRERKGERVSLKYMDAVARAWADAGVSTLNEARERIAEHEAISGGAADVLKRLNKNRTPTKDEIELYKIWTEEWGFNKDSVLAACSALVSADKPTFAYLNGVLKRLYDKGARDEKQISALTQKENEDMALAKLVFSRMGISRMPNAAQIEHIKELSKSKLELETIFYAAELSSLKDRPYSYFKRIVQGYIENGIISPEQAKAHQDSKPAAKAKSSKAKDYEQRPFSKESIQHFIIDLDT